MPNRLTASIGIIVATAACATASSEAVKPYRALLDQYCVVCHNQKLKTAGLMLDRMNAESVAGDAEAWEKVLRKLRGNAMPPQGMPRPDAARRDAFVSWLETSLDQAAAAHPNAGRTAVHRLNRAEYTNAVRDLLNVDIDSSTLLPPDDSGYGFDNIADVLSISPMLAERYLSASRKISRLAVGDPAIRPATDTYPVSKYLRQDDRMNEDLPFGSRGGVSVRYDFPVDGSYFVKIFFSRTYDGKIRGLGEANQLEIRLDGSRVKTLTIGGPAAAGAPPKGRDRQAEEQVDGMEVRFDAKAGPAVLAVTFAKKFSVPEGMVRPQYAVTSYEYAGDVTLPPAVSSVEVRGPYDVKGPGDSPSRSRIFVCRPAGPREEKPCAEKILTTLAHRAYRRPVSKEDIEPLLAFYSQARSGGSFEDGIQAAIRRILVSPNFLFRTEQDPAKADPQKPHRISDLELASRLSFFLWSSIPDDPLLDLAQREELRKPAVLEAQVRRMLKDPRSNALMNNFAGQWLYLRNIRLVSPDPNLFPEFDDNLREAFEVELKMFLESQVEEDHSVLDLLRSDYTFVNERLARHYGIPDVYGPHYRRVTLTDDARKGLLGKGAILTVTSYANRTSPVLRGKWLLENILGAPPPPPPPNVPALKDNVAGAPALSVRERMEAHRANPVCASCHKIMDPLGFSLENFDAIGKWRTTADNGAAVDVSATLADGTKVNGPAALRDALLRHSDEFAGTVASKLLTYALGRGVEYYDEPSVRQIVRKAAADQYRWSSLILAIVQSQPFQMTMPDPQLQKNIASAGKETTKGGNQP